MYRDSQMYAGAVEATRPPSSHALYFYGELGGVMRMFALAAISAALLAAITATKRMSVQRSGFMSAVATTHRIWGNVLVVSHRGIFGLGSRRSFSQRKELCPVVSRGRIHIGASGVCTWPRPGKPVFGLVHHELCSLGASDRVEWVEVETGIRMRTSVLMTSQIFVRSMPSIPSIRGRG